MHTTPKYIKQVSVAIKEETDSNTTWKGILIPNLKSIVRSSRITINKETMTPK